MAPIQRKNPMSKEIVKEKLRQKKKESKEILRLKRARLVLRNLPFKANEENLREYFGKYGEISSVDILKKPDGKLVGCAFIQFKLVQKAAKAKHYTNSQPFLGRNITVDFAKAKDVYLKEIKKEEPAEVKVKDEPIDVIDETKTEAVEEVKLDTEQSDSDSSHLSESEPEEVEEETEPKKFTPSDDVNEGKTVFIKNIPFTATNDDLRECMFQFGPIYYALICKDPLTEHSKGTGFVKFHYKEDAEKVLQSGTELTLLGNILDPHRALSKNAIKQNISERNLKKQAPKDSRNLYLLKEGVIIAGTKPAQGVSTKDMEIRLQLEKTKTTMLRNLTNIVLDKKLIVHNIPAHWSDQNLRALFQKHSPSGGVLKAYIMRDNKNVDEKGVGASKLFGFVTFAQHEQALNALRSLNNNPNIFSANKRPIVGFAIGNKTIIKKKQLQLERSRQKNPNWKDYKPESVQQKKKKVGGVGVVGEDDMEAFAGVAATPGITNMRSNYKLKVQSKLHFENAKNEKKKKKNAVKTFKEKRKDFTKQERQKINKNKDNSDSFSKMVKDYKEKLTNPTNFQKSKWYQ